MQNNQDVIIIGGNHHNTLGVIRSLGRKGINPIVILTSGGDSSFVLRSHYIKHGFAVCGSKEAVELLLSRFTNESTKSVVIACHDVISSQLDMNYDRLSPYFILPGCERQGRLTELMNKMKMGEFAIKCDMNVPRSMIVNRQTVKTLHEIPFPCIIKPLESRKGKKSEIHICLHNEELNNLLTGKDDRDFLLQQYIEKDMEFQLIGCSLRYGEEIIIPGGSVILRQPLTTNTGFLHYKPLDSSFNNTVEKSKRFIKTVGYSGLFSVEFIRDKQGRDYFMEINFRNDGNSISVTNAGVNLPYIWYLASIGKNYMNEINQIHEEFVMPEFAELDLYACGAITRHQMKSDMNKATSYMDFAPDDPKPTNGWHNYRKALIVATFKRIVRPLLRK